MPWDRLESSNPWISVGDVGSWADGKIDSPAAIVDPNDDTKIQMLFGGNSTSASTDAGFAVGHLTIDLSTSATSFTLNTNNPLYDPTGGLGDPSILYNSDGNPAPYQVYFWGEDGNNNDQIKYYTGSALDALSESTDSPVLTVSNASTGSIYRPRIQYDATNNEYVLFVNTSVQSVLRFTSSDGISWSGETTALSGSQFNSEIVKEDSSGNLFSRPKQSEGDTWYAFQGKDASSPDLYKSTDKGNTWSEVHTNFFDDPAESWESGGINSCFSIQRPNGGWLLYYSALDTDGNADTRDNFGVASASEYIVNGSESGVQHFDGSAFSQPVVNQYDGTSFVELSGVKHFDGTQFTLIDSAPDAPDIVDDFEDNDISEYSVDTGNFSTVTSTVQSGTYALEGTTGSSGEGRQIHSTSGLANYPSAGDIYRTNVYLTESGDDPFIYFGTQSESKDPNGYRVFIAKGSSTLEFQSITGSTNVTSIASTGATIPTAEWLELEVDWGASGDFTITLYNSAGAEIASVTGSDTNFTSGGIGWQTGSNNQSTQYFDNARIV